MTPDELIAGPPELIIEVAVDTVALDLGPKRVAYERAGVREYVVVRPDDHEIDGFARGPSGYDRLLPGDDGVTRGHGFPGLWLDAAAFLADDLSRVGDALTQGCQTPEQAAFVAALRP